MKTRGVSVRHVTEPTPPELAFRFANGAVAASLAEFHARLGDLPADVVHHHREHYAAWVRDILRDEPLALRLEAYGSSGADAEALRDVLNDLVGKRLRDLQAQAASSSKS